jgi:hypothetical protein
MYLFVTFVVWTLMLERIFFVFIILFNYFLGSWVNNINEYTIVKSKTFPRNFRFISVRFTFLYSVSVPKEPNIFTFRNFS